MKAGHVGDGQAEERQPNRFQHRVVSHLAEADIVEQSGPSEGGLAFRLNRTRQQAPANSERIGPSTLSSAASKLPCPLR